MSAEDEVTPLGDWDESDYRRQADEDWKVLTETLRTCAADAKDGEAS